MLADGEKLGPRQQSLLWLGAGGSPGICQSHPSSGALLLEPAAWVENKLDACRLSAAATGSWGGRRMPLFALAGLALAPPRAELCCDLGAWFLGQGRFEEAVSGTKPPFARGEDQSGGFVSPTAMASAGHPAVSAWTSWPQAEAAALNELAATYRPDSKEVAHNRAYFASLGRNPETNSLEPLK